MPLTLRDPCNRRCQHISPPGQIAASLASLSRTVDDYSGLSKKELIPEKQEKAFERVKNFRNELTDYRTQFDRLRKEREESVRLHREPVQLQYIFILTLL